MLYDNKERIFFKTHFENVCREHSSRTFWELPTENITGTFRHNVVAISSFNILRRLSQNIFKMFVENILQEHSGNFKKTSH